MAKVAEIDPKKDAIIVQLVNGGYVIYIECLNKKNEEYLINTAREIKRIF